MADSVVKSLDWSFLREVKKVLGILRFVLLARSLWIGICQADVSGWRAVKPLKYIVEKSWQNFRRIPIIFNGDNEIDSENVWSSEFLEKVGIFFLRHAEEVGSKSCCGNFLVAELFWEKSGKIAFSRHFFRPQGATPAFKRANIPRMA